MLMAFVTSLSDVWPGPIPEDGEVERALTYLQWDLDAADVAGASNTVGSSIAVAGLVLGAVVSGPFAMVVVVSATLLALLTVFGGPRVPRIVARARRSRALGAAPSLVTRTTVSMRLAPSPERAATVAAETSAGPLARSLAGHVRRCAGTPRTGLQSFGTEWEPWFPALTRACSLVESAANEPPEPRRATLDRARRTVLDGARDQMATFGATVRGPVAGIYAFGVLVPLALVSLLPALTVAEVQVPLFAVAVVYDLLLPVALVCAGVAVLVERPVAFPPPAVDRSHPDVADTRQLAVAGGVLSGALAWWLAGHLVAAWTRPIALVGTSAGTFLVVYYHPIERVRERIRAIESGLSDALALTGQGVQRGLAVESVLPTVAEQVGGPTGELFREVAQLQRRLGVDVERALFGPHGRLTTVPGPRTQSAGTVLALASRQGPPAGDVLIALADHVRELEDLEQEARRSLQQITQTLSNTASVFGPLVGGATVALAGAMGERSPLSSAVETSTPLSQTVGVAPLGLVVGIYVLWLSVFLTALSTGLARGFDRALVGYRVGIALVLATCTYLTAIRATSMLV